MAQANNAGGKSDDPQAQIDRLREQLDSLMKDRITPAVAEFAGRAESAIGSARGSVQKQADVLSDRVRQAPLTSIVIAALVGWLIGRATR